jgi:regulator of sirC expression with transglutaminase-like and TPR domain
MLNEKEIQALITLLDDSDPEVFEQVEERLVAYGVEVIPVLEQSWEQSLDIVLQQRIEELIHKIQFQQVAHNLQTWAISGAFDILQGFITVSKYQYPAFDEQKIINQIEAIKRDAWIELRYDTSPVEKVKILNHVFYNIHGFTGNVSNFHDPQNSYLNIVMETRRGNQISLAIIYAAIAQRLEIPIYGVNLPQHFILAYLDEDKQFTDISDEQRGILFYINAFNRGFIFNKRDVDYFLKQLNLQALDSFYLPCSNIQIMKRVLRNLIGAYEKAAAISKVEEVQKLYSILNEIEPDEII